LTNLKDSLANENSHNKSNLSRKKLKKYSKNKSNNNKSLRFAKPSKEKQLNHNYDIITIYKADCISLVSDLENNNNHNTEEIQINKRLAVSQMKRSKRKR